MNISKWVLDINQTFGKKYVLTGPARAKYAYKDGVRSDVIEGYLYTIVLPERAYEAIGVAIEGPCLIDDDVASTCPMVAFEKLTAKGYMSTFGARPEAKLSLKADGITVLNGNKSNAS